MNNEQVIINVLGVSILSRCANTSLVYFLMPQSQPPACLMISAASESQKSASRDNFFKFQFLKETLSTKDVVEIEIGDGDVSAVLKCIVASSNSSRSHKSSPIWLFLPILTALIMPTTDPSYMFGLSWTWR